MTFSYLRLISDPEYGNCELCECRFCTLRYGPKELKNILCARSMEKKDCNGTESSGMKESNMRVRVKLPGK